MSERVKTIVGKNFTRLASHSRRIRSMKVMSAIIFLIYYLLIVGAGRCGTKVLLRMQRISALIRVSDHSAVEDDEGFDLQAPTRSSRAHASARYNCS